MEVRERVTDILGPVFDCYVPGWKTPVAVVYIGPSNRYVCSVCIGQPCEHSRAVYKHNLGK